MINTASSVSNVRLAILLSGSGTTAAAIIDACKSGYLPGLEPVIVISNRSFAPGIKKAQTLGVKTDVIRKNIDPGSFGKRLLDRLIGLNIDLISQNGWMLLTPEEVIQEYKGRIINQHPGPLDPPYPDFGGRLMYGRRVTCARLAYLWCTQLSDRWTESCIHTVNKEYDKGGLLRIQRMELPLPPEPVTITDLTNQPEQLIEITQQVHDKLLPLEHKNVIETIKNYVSGKKLSDIKRELRLVKPGTENILNMAKELAVDLFPSG